MFRLTAGCGCHRGRYKSRKEEMNRNGADEPSADLGQRQRRYEENGKEKGRIFRLIAGCGYHRGQMEERG